MCDHRLGWIGVDRISHGSTGDKQVRKCAKTTNCMVLCACPPCALASPSPRFAPYHTQVINLNYFDEYSRFGKVERNIKLFVLPVNGAVPFKVRYLKKKEREKWVEKFIVTHLLLFSRKYSWHWVDASPTRSGN